MAEEAIKVKVPIFEISQKKAQTISAEVEKSIPPKNEEEKK